VRDYGTTIPCPKCGQPHYATPRQLQTDLQITFTCPGCGTEVVHENPTAQDIAAGMRAIRNGLGKIRI